MKRTIVVSLIILLSLTTILEALPLTSFVAASPPTWSTGSSLIKVAQINQEPTALQASDGTVWIAWSQHTKTTNIDKILFRTMIKSNGVWTNSTTLQSGTSTKAITPNLGQVDLNTIILVRAENQSRIFHLVAQNYFIGNQTWTPPYNITSSAASDTYPSLATMRNGTTFLFWNRLISGTAQIYYKTLTNGVWSNTETPLTTGQYPSATIGHDGRIMLTYATGVGTNATDQIMYNSYTTSWGTPQQVTPSPGQNSDIHPSIVQDRNGTSWIFWEREILVSAGVYTFKIFGKSDPNYGANWLADTEQQLTSTTNDVTDQHPFAIQSVRDKSLWVVYSTNVANLGEFDLYVLKAVIAPIHDILVLSITTSPTSCLNTLGTYVCFSLNPLTIFSGFPKGYNNTFAVCPGPPLFSCPMLQNPNVTINILLWNRGDYDEMVTLNLKATNTTNLQVTNPNPTILVLAGNQTTVPINWNTASVRPAHYGFAVNASIPVENIFNKPDGLLSFKNLVHLVPPGDVDIDGSDTITDISILFFDYGFSCTNVAACSPRYISSQYGDANGNGTIDIVDVGVVLNNFGTLS